MIKETRGQSPSPRGPKSAEVNRRPAGLARRRTTGPGWVENATPVPPRDTTTGSTRGAPTGPESNCAFGGPWSTHGVADASFTKKPVMVVPVAPLIPKLVIRSCSIVHLAGGGSPAGRRDGLSAASTPTPTLMTASTTSVKEAKARTPPVSRGPGQPGAEPVQPDETRSYQAFCVSPSLALGSLIHAMVGVRGWRFRWMDPMSQPIWSEHYTPLTLGSPAAIEEAAPVIKRGLGATAPRRCRGTRCCRPAERCSCRSESWHSRRWC